MYPGTNVLMFQWNLPLPSSGMKTLGESESTIPFYKATGRHVP